MKKIKYFLIIFIFLLTACANYSFDKEEFINKAKDNGYIMQEDKSGYEAYQYIKSVYYAINRESAYEIQFLELENDDYAKRFFALNADSIKEKITDGDYKKSRSLSDFEVFHAENSVEYLNVIRSKNNIIYIDAPIGYINEIEEFLEDLQIDY